MCIRDRGPLQGPSRRLSKALACAVDVLLTVLNDMFEASANLGWKFGVEPFDAFLAVAEDDCLRRKVSAHTCLVALRREVLIRRTRLGFTYGPRKCNGFVVTIPCSNQMQLPIAIHGML